MHRLSRLILGVCLLLDIILAKHLVDAVQLLQRLQKRGGEYDDSTGHRLHQREDTSNSMSPKFLTDKTKEFAVNGTGLPEVNFDAGESYAGLMPISGELNATQKLFFWFWPSIKDDAPKEILMWFNGGPGCSSLRGMMSENGPILWQDGTYKPQPNSWDWRNLTNVLWIEQPIGVGYTQGNVTISNEEGLAKQFVGFYEQFMKTFDLQNYDIYLSGESYAGYYIPYISQEILDRNDSIMPLKAVHINDPLFGDAPASLQATTLPYIKYFNNILNLNQTTIEAFERSHKECGYEAFLDKYLTYPAEQRLMPRVNDSMFDGNESYISPCDILTRVDDAASLMNPCYNIYRITDQCPPTVSRFSASGPDDPEAKLIYFNRSDVKTALHASQESNWQSCANASVFLPTANNDTGSAADMSVPPAQNGVLQKVIERTGRVIIGSGALDMLISTNGTLLVLQNTTWNGWQGFKEFPGKPFYAPYHPEYNYHTMAGAGIVGTWGSERGLTFYQVQLAGHMVPGDAPGASYRVLEVLLGRIHSLGSKEPFTTMPGNWTGGELYQDDSFLDMQSLG